MFGEGEYLPAADNQVVGHPDLWDANKVSS